METKLPVGPCIETVGQMVMAMEAAGIGLWDLRPRTNDAFVNDRCFTMAGYAPGEIPATLKELLQLVHPDDLARYMEKIDEISLGECETMSLQCRLQQKNGGWMRIIVKALAFQWDGYGVPLRIIGTHVNIDDWARAEAEKRKHQKQFEDLVENAYTGIFIAQGGFIRYANASMERICGYGRSELIGNPAINLVFDEDKEKMIRRSARCLKGETSPDFYTIRAINKSGKRVWIEANSMPFEWDEKPAILFFLRDVTLSKALERQHLQAQKLQAIGTLAGGISHDFNNILSAIMGYTEICLMNVPPDSLMAKRLDQVIKASQRARDLVGQILTFSRQEEGVQQPVNMALVAKEVVKFVRASTPATIAIEKDIDANAGAILADPTRLHQVLMNLCTNAVYAMRDGGGVLKVEVTGCSLGEKDQTAQIKGLAAGEYVHMVVSDTGHGMDQETLKHIFDPYYTTKPHGEGTGLGLSVAHGIVTSLGGNFSVYSEPNKGSAFHVYLPQMRSAPDEKKDAVKPQGIVGGRETILLVDDDEMLLDMTWETLEGLGYTVIPRSNGKTALQAFADNPQRFDLIITDQSMPQMTGLELAKQVRELGKGTPIIICSGLSTGITSKDITDYDLCAVLNKPLLLHEMAGKIRQVLG